MVFITASEAPGIPTIRDVLWWLASDSWAIERATYDYRRWAALYKYPESDTAAPRLFEMHAAQANGVLLAKQPFEICIGTRFGPCLAGIHGQELASRLQQLLMILQSPARV